MRMAFSILPLLMLGIGTAAAQDGASIYNRCAACHTRTGAGVPGAYPPLGSDFRALAAKPDGRRYLALAVIKGLNGPISVEGKPYRGMMPAQGGLDDASVAAVLNHVGGAIAKAGPAFKAFTDKEVAGYRAGAKALTAADVARLHEGAGGK
ncbi:c-type cytochrome [Sphingobium aromaticivastans]|uniref:c-type cytochrome n=2 Tax=Sphingobium TaxID=165695 RepID=UPI00159C3EA3